MKKRIFQYTVLLSFLLQSHSPIKAKEQSTNFIVIMVDDMGFSDPGCYGGEIHTPNIDKLAENGLRFKQFYNHSRCSPTRASLLTGQYAHKVGLHRNGKALKKNSATIAEILKENGYNTGMIGKWHLSKSIKYKNSNEEHQKWLDHRIETDTPFADLNSYPINRGFDKHYGVIWGVVNFFDPFSLVNGEDAVKQVPDDYYITTAITDTTVAYINQFSQKKEPFFLYVAHTAPHWPLHALDEDIEKYKNIYDDGWHDIRKKRYQRQIELGLFNKDEATLPEVMGNKWSNLSEEKKKYMASKMMAHAAMVDRVDQGIGQIVQALKDNGQFENTVIVVLSDNGASPEVPLVPGYDRTGHTRTGEVVKYEKDTIAHVGNELSYTGIGREWANTANTPFRFWKKESFEGGNHTPCIIHWPNTIKKNKGTFIEERAHVMDLVPTLLNIAAVEYPTTLNRKEITQLDGKSLLPVLKGKKREGHKYLFAEHECGRAIYSEEWKLVSHTKSHKAWNDFNNWELYNLKNDKTEMRNVIKQYPEIAKELETEWEGWWKNYSNLQETVKVR